MREERLCIEAEQISYCSERWTGNKSQHKDYWLCYNTLLIWNIKEESQTSEFLILSKVTSGSCALQNSPDAPKAITISSIHWLQWVFSNAFTPGQSRYEMNCDQENRILYQLRHFGIHRNDYYFCSARSCLQIFFFQVLEWYSSKVCVCVFGRGGGNPLPTAFSFWISDTLLPFYSNSISY